MKTTHYKCIVITLSFYLFCSCTSHIATKDNVITAYETSTNLEADFHNPPGYAKIQNYWWWLNSNVTKECITLDLEAMKANGYGGAFIYDAGSETSDIAKETDAGPVFLSDNWMELFGHAI